MLNSDGHWFTDEAGRRLLLRGVNLGGDSKLPTFPDGRTHIPTDFSDHRVVSFVGRPFPLDEADAHFRRLRHWGFNTLRLLTTWEAIEHAGPGEYDVAYLDYFYEIAKRAGDYGFYLFVDPHQDVWSRMSGGCGAPGWTLELAGFDIARLDAAEAAITQQRRGGDYGMMVWANNSGRLACATMFSLFFGGARVAPSLRVGDESIETFLQRHFISALARVAERLKSLPHVLGFGTLNEPQRGYLGLESLARHTERIRGSTAQLTAFQSIAVGSGVTVTVPFIEREGTALRHGHTVTLNPGAVSAWRTPRDDLWQREGVWEMQPGGNAVLLRDDHFALNGYDFFRDGVRPFARRFARALREIHPGCYLFIESEPAADDDLTWENAAEERVVNAGHWYDTLTLFTKRYDPREALVWGRSGAVVRGVEAVEESFAAQLAGIKAESAQRLGGVPTLIGEFGVPFDLNGGASYHTENFSPQAAALDAYYDALDANLLHSTLWNYSASNTNEWGDGWNGEDLSIFSLSQQWNPYDLDSGGRGLLGFCRPTSRAVHGVPLSQRFDLGSRRYELRIRVIRSSQASGALLPGPGASPAPTELYVPRLQYPEGYTVKVSSGKIEHDLPNERLYWFGYDAGEQILTVQRTT